MRKLVLAIVLITSAIAGMAFTQKGNVKKATFSQYWYELIPNGDPGNYMDYERVTSQPCSGVSSNVCGVFAEQYSGGDIEHPNLLQIGTTVYKP